MADDRIPHWGEGSLADTVLVSNRGPLAFHLEDGVPVAGTSAGGLAGSLRPLVVGTGATWVACALGEADRAAAAAGLMPEDGLRIELVEPEPDVYNLAYNVVSNAMLWFCHHHLFDAARRPRADQRWLEAWDAYRELNQLFAERVAKVAPEGGRVLVQDYHLALMGSDLARLRPDLRTAHFTHTPFADPVGAPHAARPRWATSCWPSMAGFGACGFHTERWAAAYRAGQDMASGRPRPGTGADPTFVSPLSTDPERLAALDGRARGRPGPGPHRGAGRRLRPPGHRPGRPDGAVEEPPARVLGLRRAAGAPAPATGAGGLRGPGLPHPAGTPRVPGLPERGRVHRGPHQPAVGHARAGPRSSSRSRTTTRGRWPPSPATTSCWSTRCATDSTWWPRRGR